MRFVISSITAAAFAAAVFTAPAMAAGAGTLPSGKPAGVQQAQLSGDIVWVGLAVAIAAAAAFAASSGLDHPATVAPPNTSSTVVTSISTSTTSP